MSAHATTAVTNLIATYAELVDTGDFAGVGALFADAVFIGSGGSAAGAAAVEQMLRSTVILYDDGTPRTHHVTTNIAVDVGEAAETATARSYVTVFQAVAELPLQPIAAGRYRDRFECIGGQWRFARRRVHIHLIGDLSRHLRGQPLKAAPAQHDRG
ncbi:nuclear transport factor 2 family protein [Nocardia sp. alder85J]|uniref:nuclear transport factor 2 family protein n=1 Tax=Nocardia sp. alder85J TaxID=2862949 RepID=UPI001CD4046D|nr:nuclear transport factor 2 family protein [Nocardia sp. alder85J]MCX4090847.1 nuclear transport factor 2 family protein [Nocardia sp. alder85J]